ISANVFSQTAKQSGFTVQAVYANTGTVKLKDADGNDFEFAAFRSDKYVRGKHVPDEIFFTDDILLDANRRDFTANAVYYDIVANRFVDPLNGIPAIREKRLTTVDRAEKVFGEDGLRLMRLARQAAQLGFSPDAECLNGAKRNAKLIADVSAERIFTELTAILRADEKYGNPNGPFEGLTLLLKTGVLDVILPELALGNKMAQRADFHKYDVLIHSFKAVTYAAPEIRLAALLHDVGKPFCALRDGNVHAHPIEGERIAEEILLRLKAPKKATERIKLLVRYHMYDFDCKTKESKLRRFFIDRRDLLDDLMKLKQADFSGCMDDTSVCPTNQKWQTILAKMQAERVPFTTKELNVSGADLLTLGIPPRFIALILKEFLLHLALNPRENEKERLLTLAPKFLEKLQKEQQKQN
ncbi:MAG: HD domain-containing protein, partial [Clostridia bacterium]|nr:HD domain-containing protein [Clostridia bacterium]